MAKCSQCDKPAIVGSLCVDHYHKWVETNYMLFTMMASQYNLLDREFSRGTGGIVPPNPIAIPSPLSTRDNLTFKNINVDRSTIGAINTGVISSLDASITLMQSSGKNKLADAIKELTQAIYDSKEVDDELKNEIIEQLEFLVAQASAEPENRSTGLIKTVLSGLRASISVAAGLLTIWDKVEPLIKAALGVS